MSEFDDEYSESLETDFRKREIGALEKEMRDIRSRGLALAEE